MGSDSTPKDRQARLADMVINAYPYVIDDALSGFMVGEAYNAIG